MLPSSWDVRKRSGAFSEGSNEQRSRLGHTVDDDGGKIEEHAGDLVRVGFDGLARHDAVEDLAGVGEIGRPHELWSDAARIGGLGGPETGVHDVLHVVSQGPGQLPRGTVTLLLPSAVR